MAIRTGDLAPDVSFSMHTGELLSLKSFRDKQAVVVYFYPKDHTPICAREACAFRDAYEDFLAAGAAVIGVSSDSERSHDAFARFHRLPFLLASDAGGKLRQAFGVPRTLGLVAGRVTYVIDIQGVVRHVFNAQLLVDRHVSEALTVVRELMRALNVANT